MNDCTFIGRFTADPELAYTPNGTAKCNFRLAVDGGQYTNKEGDKVKKVDFLDFIAWQKTAEFIANPDFFEKGKPVVVKAEANQEQWEDTEGNKRSRVIFKVSQARFLPQWSGGNNEETEEEKPKSKNKKSDGFQPSQKKRARVNETEDEEIQEEYL